MPRNSLGIPIVASSVGGAIINVNDVLWESFDSNEIAINYAENYTNLVLHSQDTTQAEQWTKTNTTIDTTLYEAPDNSATANAIKSDSTGTKVYRILQGNLSVTAGKTFTLSVHVKKSTLSFARVQFSDGSVDYRADFNLNTGAVTNTSNTIRTQVDAMDDDWYRCSITFKAQNTTNGSSNVFAQSEAGSFTPNVAVSGVVLLFVWGFQLEENIEASPYIPTTTEARTATETLNDLSSVWDFDSADLMPQETPNSEGVWETSDNLVLNHTYEELGSELVANGGFDTDSDWVKQAGWTISGGTANFADTGSGNRNIYQTILTIGKTYQLTISLLNYVQGGIRNVAQGSPIPTYSANGTYTETFVATTTSLFLKCDPNSILSIDNVSVKQVDPNNRWTLTGGTSISDGKMTVTGASGTSIGFQSVLVQGTTYELTYTISNYSRSSGSTEIINDDGVTIQSISGNGTFTAIFTHSIASGNLIFRAVSGTNSYQVDNVTVREYAIQPQDV